MKVGEENQKKGKGVETILRERNRLEEEGDGIR